MTPGLDAAAGFEIRIRQPGGRVVTAAGRTHSGFHAHAVWQTSRIGLSSRPAGTPSRLCRAG